MLGSVSSAVCRPVFVAYMPYVWLPAVMVLAALAGHLVIFRALGRF
jgi:hypothetical protein